MFRPAFVLGAFTLLFVPLAVAQSKDAAGCKDPALFPTRIAGYRIEKCEVKPFASYDFFVLKGPKKIVEGELTFVQYTVDRREDDRTGLEVVRNYENAIRTGGGRVVASDPQRWVNGVFTVPGGEAWAQAEKGNGKIWLRIVQTKAMQQVIVADAAALANSLAATGHVVAQGIYFDTNSAALKPESSAAIAQIAALLKSNAALKVYVVGHTDSVGNDDANLRLSTDRAQSVVRALVTSHGIAASRLKAFGNGPFAPVASNASEEGRSRNRRVELVAAP